MEAIVLYPLLAVGHLISMVELAKLVLTHKPSLSVHVIIFKPPFGAGSTASYISKVSATIPSIAFHHLPTITLPPSIAHSSRHHETLMFEVLKLNNPHLHQTLVSISKDYSISALIADVFCYAAISVTVQLNIPIYLFFPSGAGCLSLLLHFPTIHRNTTKSLKDMNAFLVLPGLSPVLSIDMPKPLLERDDKAYEFFVDCLTQWSKAAGIIANTFESLEPTATKLIRNGLCIPDGRTPPLYCIGPLISADNRSGSDGVPECLTWLDFQPSESVVFLCFGSAGLFSAQQSKEIAFGLEKSGQRFLWVVRSPPSNNENVAMFAQPDPDLDLLLPEGFLDRTKERGLVVKSWAPQVAVLNHASVGGFVTHCGWNSVLEAISAGVPMVAWPLYAEQRLNRVIMVEDIKIALPMTEFENGFVISSEVEKRVRELMDPEKGESVRKRTIDLKYEARDALSEGGSSLVGLTEFIESWKRNWVGSETITQFPT